MAFNINALYFLCLFSLAKAAIDIEECLNYTVYPSDYELNIYPYIHGDNSYYQCDMTIIVIAHAPTQKIELDAKDLEIIGDIKVFDGDRNIINGARPFEYNAVTGKLVIFLNKPLIVYTESNERKYYIKITFKKYLKEDTSNGVFLVKYFDEQSKDFKYLITTRLSPDKAKYFFPCFSDVHFETGFKFKVFILQRVTGVQYTNTSLVIAEPQKTENINNDYVIVDYLLSPQVGLHQVGFHYSTFASNQATSKNKKDTLVVWAPRNELKNLNFILSYGIRIIDIMHEYEKIARPLVRGPINLVAVPTILDGYEVGSWNLLTNRYFKQHHRQYRRLCMKRCMNVDETKEVCQTRSMWQSIVSAFLRGIQAAHRIATVEQFTSIKQIETMTFELTQQLSRIWLGSTGEVRRMKWNEEWFKEGMATYFAYYFLTQYNHGVRTAYRIPLSPYGLQMKHKAMAVDWHPHTVALDSFHTKLAVEISHRYKELVTMKTAAILWMLENWVESEKFHEVLVNYINSSRARKGNIVFLQNFTKTIDQETIHCLHQFFNGSTASKILHSWFRRPGYPVINVQVFRDRNLNAVQLKQRQFSFTYKNREDTDYLIPISYIIQHNQNCFNCYRPRFTIGEQTYTFGENLNNGWIILNINGTGYYRVNYDATTWRLIAKTLKENMLSINELNRAQIVNDVLALYVAGDVQLSIAMEVLDYLDLERSPTVWEAVISGFELFTIEGAACNMTRHLYWEWEDFMNKKITPIYTMLVTDIDQRLITRSFRSIIVAFACSLNYEPCQNYVRKMYVEDKRGRHHLFPDCRSSYFYVLANETFSHTYSRELNVIEEEDKNIAEHKIRNKNRFLMTIPIGKPRPMPLISTTETPTVTESAKQTAHDESTTNKFSLVILSSAILINIVIMTYFPGPC